MAQHSPVLFSTPTRNRSPKSLLRLPFMMTLERSLTRKCSYFVELYSPPKRSCNSTCRHVHFRQSMCRTQFKLKASCSHSRRQQVPPNTALELTPQCGPRSRAFCKKDLA